MLAPQGTQVALAVVGRVLGFSLPALTASPAPHCGGTGLQQVLRKDARGPLSPGAGSSWSCTSLGRYRRAQVALAIAVTALGLYLANLLGWTNNKVFLVDFSCFTPPERCASAFPGAFLSCQCFGRASFPVHHRSVYVLLVWRAAM